MRNHIHSKRLIFCCFFLFCLTSTVFGEEVNLRDSIKAVLNNDRFPLIERFYNAGRLFDKYIPEPVESENLYLNLVMPFFDKHARNESEKQDFKALSYRSISVVYSRSDQADDYKKTLAYAEKALQTIELSKNDDVRVAVYHNYAKCQMVYGDLALAHDYYYKAIGLYEKQKKYLKAMECLYHLAIAYLDIIDVDGMKRIIDEMERIVLLDPKEALQCKLNAVKSSYFSTIWGNDPTPDIALQDSVMLYIRKNLYLIANHREKLDQNLSPAWEYFNMATRFFAFYTDRNDSIVYYLNKALEEKELISDKNIAIEVDMSVSGQFAEMYLREKNYKLAEEKLLYGLSLLNEVGIDCNTIVVDFSETYQFLVQLYIATNRPAEALKYQMLLQESESRRYKNEKLMAINEMAAKYETEKKLLQIDTLKKEKKNTQVITVLVAGLAFLLLLSLLLLIRYFKTRKEKMEQSIYEHALLAEMKHNELEDIKRGLQTSSTQIIAKQVIQRIDESIIEQEKSKQYKDALLKLDTEVFDKAFISEKSNLTNMDMKYILCFAVGMDTNDTALAFNVEFSSVHMVRYRIKKKINKESSILTLI